MSGASGRSCWRCPRCLGELAYDDARATCAACGTTYPCADGVLDARADRSVTGAPAPLCAGDAAVAHTSLTRGGSWKEALEELLFALPAERAEALMLLLREGRGAWLAVAGATGGSTLFVGNALSGTVVALARSGHDVVVVDRSEERVHLARPRDAALATRTTCAVIGGDSVRLPFVDDAFALVVHEGELPGAGSSWGHDLSEVRRVAAGEVVVTADNRLGYKLSRNVRGEFRVRRPLELVARALRPPGNVKTLAGYRRTLRDAGFADPRAYALYPHAGEFAQVAALDEAEPCIFVGPLERRNRAKVWAARLGLVPWLAPSFAWSAGRRAPERRLDRVLAAVAERLDEPVPTAEHVVATRGNSIVVHTRPAGDSRDDPNEDTGAWTLHVPLSPHQRALVERHFVRLGELRRSFPHVPVPRDLSALEVEGLFVTVERRLPGLSLSQLGTSPPGVLPAVCEALTELVVEPARTFDDATIDELVTAKVEAIVRHVRDARTASRVRELGRRTQDALAGRRLPLVLQHADLRPKHVLVDARGALTGIVDWGSSTSLDLPYFDALHVVVQARKQEEDLPPGGAWELARTPPRLSDDERTALRRYGQRLEIDGRSLRAIEDGYPIWVAAQAERTWDYSRPRWLHRQFGL